MSDALTLSPRAEAAAPARTWLLALVLLLALALRLYQLGTISLWTDEFFTLFYPQLGLAHLWGPGLRSEPTSPLYYTLVAALEAVAGLNALTARLPSLVASLASIALAWALARTLFPQSRAALLAALLLTLAPTNIVFAQEARAYALQAAALALALLGLATTLRGPLRRGLLLYVLGAAAAMYCHPTSLLALAALNAAALSAALPPRPLLDRAALLRWIAANLLVALLCLPLLPIFLSPQAAQATTWIPPLTRWSIEGTVGDLLLGPAIGAHAAQAAEIALPILAALLLPPWRPGRAALTTLLLVPALFVALILAASLIRPMLLTRTIAWTLVPLCTLLGDVLSRRFPLLAAPALLLAAAAAALHITSHASQLEDWRGLLARLDPAANPLIVLDPHTSPAALALYAPTLPSPVRLADDSGPIPEITVTERVFHTTTITPSDLAAAIAGHRPVRLLYRRPEYRWMRALTAHLPPPDHRLQDIPGPNPNIGALEWN